MTTCAPSREMRLADEYGPVLSGRLLGEAIRRDVTQLVGSGEKVVLDLDGVEAVSPSFADEIFGKLPSEVGESVEFINVGDGLQSMANIARAGRADAESSGA